MSTVHVFGPPSKRYNLGAAQEFGTLKFHALPHPFKTEEFLEVARDIHIGPNDFVAATGPMLSVLLGVVAVLQSSSIPIKLLLFNASTDEYVVRTIDNA